MSNGKKPNIVLIMSDQHSRHVVGCYGDSVIQTPHLDALASRGTLFENMYCNSPLCVPARMSFMTGREPHEISAWGNESVLASDIPTFAHALGQAGYEVVLCGRMHFNGPDQRHGFQKRIFPEASKNGVGELANTSKFERASIEKSGPGRNHYLLYDEDCALAARRYLQDFAYGKSERPLCLIVGLAGPHCPFVCPEEEFARYWETVQVPEYSSDYLATRHPYTRRFAKRSGVDNLSKHEIRRTRAAYYGMVDFVDRQIGTVLDTISETGLADDTAVIYTSDHGELAGEHGLWWKMSFYEGSVGVPLLASWPGHFEEGRREEMPVTLADLAPTLAALGGAPSIMGVQASGFADVLLGASGDSEWAIFSEMIGDSIGARLSMGPTGGPARMMRKGSWKCNYYHEEPAELFNLTEDPHEENDLVNEPAYRKIVEEMSTQILSSWNPEDVAEQAKRQRETMKYIQAAPEDPNVLAGNRWKGPRNYGLVRSV